MLGEGGVASCVGGTRAVREDRLHRSRNVGTRVLSHSRAAELVGGRRHGHDGDAARSPDHPGMVDTMNTSDRRVGRQVARRRWPCRSPTWYVPLALPSTNTALAVGSKLSAPPYGSVVLLAAGRAAKSSGALLVLVRVKGIAFPDVPGVTLTYVPRGRWSASGRSCGRRRSRPSAVMAGWATALTL